MAAAGDLSLDLEVFEGPFDLLLALVLREEVELADVPVAEIVACYLELVAERGELDLESATEFLVLVATLLELKVRLLFGLDADGEDELSPEQAGAELLARLVEYRRFQGAAGWLRARLAEGPRVFRTGPAPLVPRPERVVTAASEDPAALRSALRRLLEPPPRIDVSGIRRRLVPLDHFLARFRALARERRAFTFDDAAGGLDRLSQAAAFVAVLELLKRGELVAEQHEPFGPIRLAGVRAAAERAIA